MRYAHNNNGQWQIIINLPTKYKGINGFQYSDIETLNKNGFYEYEEPIYNNKTHKLTDFVKEQGKVTRTVEPLNDIEIQNIKKQEVSQFMEAKRIEGERYVNDIKTDITISLIGLPKNEVNRTDKELITSVEPMLDLIEKGDWWSALNLELPYPTITIVEDLFIKIKEDLQNYILTNYPTEI